MNESSIGGRKQMAHLGSDTTMYLKEIKPFLGFPGGSEVKGPACTAGDLGSIPGLERFPWRREWQPTPVLLPGESHGQRSLVGYSPRGRKESDTTERLHFHFQTFSRFSFLRYNVSYFFERSQFRK